LGNSGRSPLSSKKNLAIFIATFLKSGHKARAMKKLSRLFRISCFAKSPVRVIFLYLLNPGGGMESKRRILRIDGDGALVPYFI
jgi:hypothetical protein